MFSRVLPSSEGNIWLPNIQNHPPNSLNCPGTIAIETKGADFLGWFITHIEFVFLKSQWMLVHFVKWIRSLLAYGKKTVSSKSSFTEIWSNGLWNCSLEDILYMKYNLRNTVLWYKIYNSIHIPTNLWQEWNHAPSKNSKHTYIYIQNRFCWEGFLYQTTKDSDVVVVHLVPSIINWTSEPFFDIFGNTHLNLSDYLSVKPPQPQHHKPGPHLR